jgi:hypothetical protein
MDVFLSWSGASSRLLAEALRDWLPLVLQSLKPWISATDVAKGARWGAEVAAHLANARVGILCLTAENLQAPWVLFEAGALSKVIASSFVCPYLLDIEPSALQGPLVQFQAARAEREDTRRLIHTVNKALDSGSLAEKQLDETFAVWWPALEEKLTAIRGRRKADLSVTAARPDRELLEELLDLVRDLVRRRDASPVADASALRNKVAGNAFDKSVTEAMNMLERAIENDASSGRAVTRRLAERLPEILQKSRSKANNGEPVRRNRSRPEAERE